MSLENFNEKLFDIITISLKYQEFGQIWPKFDQFQGRWKYDSGQGKPADQTSDYAITVTYETHYHLLIRIRGRITTLGLAYGPFW